MQASLLPGFTLSQDVRDPSRCRPGHGESDPIAARQPLACWPDHPSSAAMTGAAGDDFGAVTDVVLAGKREGQLHAQVEIARLLLRAGGLFELGLAGNRPLALAAAVDSAILSGRFLPASLAIRGARSRLSVAVPAGFARRLVLPLAFAAGLAARSAIDLPLAFVPVLPVAGGFRPAIQSRRKRVSGDPRPVFAVAGLARTRSPRRPV